MIEKQDSKVIDDFFEGELKDALEEVANDMGENLINSVDIRAREEITEKRKLCKVGHINDNVRSNRKVCDRKNCKAELKESNKELRPYSERCALIWMR